MKDNKVEVVIHSKLGFSEKKIIENHKAEVQEVLDTYNRKGYKLISTTSPANNILYLFLNRFKCLKKSFSQRSLLGHVSYF